MQGIHASLQGKQALSLMYLMRVLRASVQLAVATEEV